MAPGECVKTSQAMPTCRPRRPSAMALSLLALAVTSACDRITSVLEEKAQEVAEEMSPPDEVTPSAEPALTDDEQVAAKLALYIECRNRASPRIRDSWERYDERVSDDGTPRKRGVEPYLYKIDTELTPCEEAVVKGPTAPPPLPEIEAAMARYLEHAKVFATTTVALDTYYEHKGYEGDAWARGKELAPGFRAAWQAWDAADSELDTLVQARKDVIDRAMLAHIEEHHGKDIEWHTRNLMLAAKAFVRCASASPPAEPKKPRPETEGCTDAMTALQQAEADFRAYFDAHRTKADAVFWMSAFEGSVTDFMAEATKVSSHAPGRAPKGKGAADELAKLVDEYDGLVSDSNNLRFEP